jgi:hypothetical protein
MLDRRTLLIAGFGVGAALALPRRAEAQEPSTERYFEKVIPHSTGRNGYEELVAATDELRQSLLFTEAQQLPACPLAVRRRVFTDPPVISALALLDRGLAKPVLSPRDPDAMNAATLFPELAGFRNLARLLGFQQYVLFADGRVPDAIAAMRKCSLLGRVVQFDTLIAGLVGQAIGSIGAQTVAMHLGQFSARDCEMLYQACLEELAQPDLLSSILEGERRFGKNTLRSALEAPPGPTFEDAFGMDDPESRRLGRDLRQQASTAEARAALLEDYNRRIDDFYDRLLDETARPAWERATIEPPADGSLAGRLVSLLAPVFNGVGNAYTRGTARDRMLACHAAIRRYLWEHDRLPESLAALDLRELAVDPFTGDPLQYQLFGRRYRLISAGQPATDDDPQAVNGRRPYSVVPGE